MEDPFSPEVSDDLSERKSLSRLSAIIPARLGGTGLILRQGKSRKRILHFEQILFYTPFEMEILTYVIEP